MRILLSNLVLLLLSSVFFQVMADSGDDNVRLHGVIVDQPCVIPGGDENITLDFGTISNKFLYSHQRTAGEEFSIHLDNCDTTVAETVTVKFDGSESSSLPGYLRIDNGSAAKNIAIGIEKPDGTLIKLNSGTFNQQLLAGSNVIQLNAYVQAEPEALINKTIKEGTFSATATFTLSYE